MSDTSGINSTITSNITTNGVQKITGAILASVLTAITTWAAITFAPLISPTFTGTVTLPTMTKAGGIAAGPNSFCLGCNVAEGNAGLLIGVQGGNSWGVVQPSMNYSGAQWQLYGSQAQGRAAASGNVLTVSGPGTISTTPDSVWIGLPFFYWRQDGVGFGGRYKVASVTGSTITVLNLDGSTPTLTGNGTFHFVADVSSLTVNCSGVTCTRTAGDYFSPFASGGYSSFLVIGGIPYTVNSATTTTAVLASTPGTVTGATATTYAWDFDTISVFRVQKYFGASEENLFIGARAIGDYEIRPLASGTGQYLPFVLGNGASGGTLYNQVTVQPDGVLSLGGGYGNDMLRFAANDLSVSTNYTFMGRAQSGVSPSFAARGNTADTNIGMAFDTLGTGAFSFTSHAFGNTEFQIFAGGGVDWLSAASATGNPTIAANGADPNVSINLAPKGTGSIQVGGVVGVSCTVGTVSAATMVVTKGIVTHC